MISDTLSETNETIDEYRKDFADAYKPFADELDLLQGHIDRVRVLLDTPPKIGD